jgi:hypothetical protein
MVVMVMMIPLLDGHDNFERPKTPEILDKEPSEIGNGLSKIFRKTST